MGHIDLSEIFDNCYESHQDFSGELSLCKENGLWRNDEVSFWKDESYGWRFKEKNGHYNYGYDTLRGAITSYLYGQCGKQASDSDFCASRMLSCDYSRNLEMNEIHCAVSIRYFKGEDVEQFSHTCDAFTIGINALLTKDGEQELSQGCGGIGMTL